MPTKKVDPMTRLRRLLLEARDEVYQTVDWTQAHIDPVLMLRVQLIRRIDKALTDSLTEEATK